MDKCTKIVIGYILAIVLCTVLILSIRVKLSKRVHLSKNVREDFSSEGVYLFFGAIPIIIIGIVLLVALLAELSRGLLFLGSKLPVGCTDCYKDWIKN